MEPIRRPHPVMVPIVGKPVKTAIAGLYPKRSNPAPLINAWIDHVDQWIHSAPEDGGLPAGMGGTPSP
ncbi:hypothetical protein D3C83_324490 [compost metagenome]